MSAPFAVKLRRSEKLAGLLWLAVFLFLAGDLISLLLDALGLGGDLLRLNAVYFVTCFLISAAVFWRFLRDSLCLAGKTLSRLIRGLLLGFFLYEFLQVGLGMLYEVLLPELTSPNDDAIRAMANENFRLVTVLTVLLSPLIEEPLIRGLVFGWVREKSRPAAYLISAAVFAAMHVIGFIGSAPWTTLLPDLPLYALPGVALCACYEMSGTIWGPILLHMLINAVGMWAMTLG